MRGFSPTEGLMLKLLAEEYGISKAEVLRIGLRLIWKKHKKGLFEPTTKRSKYHTKKYGRRF